MSAVATKDHLLNILNSATNQEELTNVCNNVLIPVLENTVGLWQECNYCYKAQEIATRACKALDHYLTTCQHYKTLEKLGLLRDKLRLLAEQYYKLQQESFSS